MWWKINYSWSSTSHWEIYLVALHLPDHNKNRTEESMNFKTACRFHYLYFSQMSYPFCCYELHPVYMKANVCWTRKTINIFQTGKRYGVTIYWKYHEDVNFCTKEDVIIIIWRKEVLILMTEILSILSLSDHVHLECVSVFWEKSLYT